MNLSHHVLPTYIIYYGVFRKEIPNNYLEVLLGGIDAEKNTKRKVKHLKIALYNIPPKVDQTKTPQAD